MLDKTFFFTEANQNLISHPQLLQPTPRRTARTETFQPLHQSLPLRTRTLSNSIVTPSGSSDGRRRLSRHLLEGARRWRLLARAVTVSAAPLDTAARRFDPLAPECRRLTRARSKAAPPPADAAPGHRSARRQASRVTGQPDARRAALRRYAAPMPPFYRFFYPLILRGVTLTSEVSVIWILCAEPRGCLMC